MDEIAELVGVQPNILRLLLTDPRLGLGVMLGPRHTQRARKVGWGPSGHPHSVGESGSAHADQAL